MEFKKADAVISLNGRDEGKHFLVVGTEEGYSLLADGKGRRIEKPKRKKNKHIIMLEKQASGSIAEKMAGGERVTNNEIRRALAALQTDSRQEVCRNGERRHD